MALLKDIYIPSGQDLEVPQTIKGMYMVYDYYPMDLGNVLTKKNIKLDVDQVIKISYQLLTSVNFLHSANVLHRDLKPENILVDDDFETKICDFGLSRGVKGLRQDKKVRKMSMTCFTRQYRPPEIIFDTKH